MVAAGSSKVETCSRGQCHAGMAGEMPTLAEGTMALKGHFCRCLSVRVNDTSKQLWLQQLLPDPPLPPSLVKFNSSEQQLLSFH